MAYIEDVSDYKNRLMYDILNDLTLVQLIDEDKTLSTSSSLAYTQVFPYEFLPDTVEEGKVYICFDVDILESYSKTFSKPIIHIWCFVHKSVMRMNDGKLRLEEILSNIDKIINGSRYYGLGELQFTSMQRFAPIVDFPGKVISYKTVEFSNTNQIKRTIPANRKDW